MKPNLRCSGHRSIGESKVDRQTLLYAELFYCNMGITDNDNLYAEPKRLALGVNHNLLFLMSRCQVFKPDRHLPLFRKVHYATLNVVDNG